MPKPKSHQKIRELVEGLLQRHGVTKAAVPVDVIARAEGAELRYLPYDGDLSGMIFRDESRTVIGVNSLHPPNRQRFTIAHELGHMLLHKGKEVFVDSTFLINRRDDVSSQAIDPEEIEANRFAAELLIPFSMLEQDLKGQSLDIEGEETINSMAKKYQVSLQAMMFRITSVIGLK